MEKTAATSALASTFTAHVEAACQRLQQGVDAGLGSQFPGLRRIPPGVFLHLVPEGTRLTDLAERSGMTKQRMAYIVAQLEKRGYVEAAKHPTDGRAVLVKPTAKGQQYVNTVVSLNAAIEARLATALGPARVADFRQLLTSIDEVLGKSESAKK